MIRNLLTALCLSLPFAFSANAASVFPLMLDEIIDTAPVAFHGTCIANRTERDVATNFIVTITTFAVRDVIKGNIQATHVIKQIGGVLPSGEVGMRVGGVPTFTVGEEYVVFLAGVSSGGFSSPIGLSQGKFTVTQKPTGKTVSNGRSFKEMTLRKQMVDSITETPSNELGLEEFIEIVRARSREPK